MKVRHYVIIGLLFFVIAFLWIDRANVIHKWRDAEMRWAIRGRQAARMLAEYDEIFEGLVEELKSRGMTLEEIEKVINKKTSRSQLP